MTRQTIGKPINILLVEDSPGDARLTAEALKDAKIANRLFHVTNGVDALAFLRRATGYADAPRPDVILLDLNLPKKGGHEVLGEVKSDPSLRRIPVVILTSSQAEEDIAATYDFYANCYITKPIDLEGFMKVVKAVEEFWLTIVRLPRE